jgi:hypothetical protein
MRPVYMLLECANEGTWPVRQLILFFFLSFFPFLLLLLLPQELPSNKFNQFIRQLPARPMTGRRVWVMQNVLAVLRRDGTGTNDVRQRIWCIAAARKIG